MLLLLFLTVVPNDAGNLEPLSFLAGHWRRESASEMSEEQWLAPRGHIMLGVGRTMTERNSFFEFLRIEDRKEGVVYVTVLQGGPATEFRLLKADGKSATFENPKHDFPQRIRYWLDAQGLHARIEDLAGKKSKEWLWTRVVTMESFVLNGYELTGAEYWPYKGSADIDYPKDVLWGFYPKKGDIAPGETDPNADSATPQAIACAEKAYAELRAFLLRGDPRLRAAVAKGPGVTNRFYLWTNDYSRTDDKYPHKIRPGQFWYWRRKIPEPGRVPGYWKWESTLYRDGRCETPTASQIDETLGKGS